MKLLRFASAACLAVSFAFASSANAAPLAPSGFPSGQTLVMPVGGCHAGVRRHYVPEFGGSRSHFHRRNCRPVRASTTGGRDCHRDASRHYLPQYGGRVVHRHVGPNCRIRVLRRHYGSGGRDCIQFGPVRYCVS